MNHRLLRPMLLVAGIVLPSSAALADDDARAKIEAALQRTILAAEQPLADVRKFVDPRVAQLARFENRQQWEQYVAELRRRILDEIVFRGAAGEWRAAQTKVEWLDTIEGLPGYRIRKLRYEILPGLWIPALLYEPSELKGSVPAVLNVNGHDPQGKTSLHEQLRSINCAKRGMLALHPEWIGMGQLRTDGFAHGRMNQLDLCGTSGLSVFYLCLSRAIDLLCEHPHADVDRVAVAGLSGGGWQTAWIAALDKRVRVANPVAGYTGLRTAIAFNDMGDSEQIPSDFGTLADGTHLTAMRAPRPTLLTYNAADECCFKAAHTLEPLLAAARPIFALFSAKNRLRTHVNFQPGTHNFERENREAFYTIMDDFFFPDSLRLAIFEQPSEEEIKPAAELEVPMPSENLDFSWLAKRLAADLPRGSTATNRSSDKGTRDQRRERLEKLLHVHRYDAVAKQQSLEEKPELAIRWWLVQLAADWTVPVVEFEPVKRSAEPPRLLLADGGYAGLAAGVDESVTHGRHVFVVDPLLIGQSQVTGSDPQVYFAMALASVGERPLGLQASQLAAVARWIRTQTNHKVQLSAAGRRTSVMALITGAIEPEAVGTVALHDSLTSLRQLIDENRAIEEYPELFPFGLLAEFDLPEIGQLANGDK